MQGVVLGIILFGAISAMPQADKSEVNSDMSKWEEYCIKETGFNISSVINLDNIPRTAKCFMACLLEQEGSLRSNGTFDVDKFKNSTVISTFCDKEGITEKVRNALENCSKDAKNITDDKCETTNNVLMCTNNKVSGLFADIDKKN